MIVPLSKCPKKNFWCFIFSADLMEHVSPSHYLLKYIFFERHKLLLQFDNFIAWGKFIKIKKNKM